MVADPWMVSDPWGGSATSRRTGTWTCSSHAEALGPGPSPGAKLSPPSASFTLRVAKELLHSVVVAGGSRQVVAASSVALLARTLGIDGEASPMRAIRTNAEIEKQPPIFWGQRLASGKSAVP